MVDNDQGLLTLASFPVFYLPLFDWSTAPFDSFTLTNEPSVDWMIITVRTNVILQWGINFFIKNCG